MQAYCYYCKLPCDCEKDHHEECHQEVIKFRSEQEQEEESCCYFERRSRQRVMRTSGILVRFSDTVVFRCETCARTSDLLIGDVGF